MRRVKGSLLVNWVRAIRADKAGAYPPLLSDEAREVVQRHIGTASWYPYAAYRSCFDAVVKVVLDGDLAGVRQWGRIYGEQIMLETYGMILDEESPMGVLERYAVTWEFFYDFGQARVEGLGEGQALFSISDFDPDFEALYVLIEGWLERSLELVGSKDLTIETVERTWKGAPRTSYRITWRV